MDINNILNNTTEKEKCNLFYALAKYFHDNSEEYYEDEDLENLYDDIANIVNDINNLQY